MTVSRSTAINLFTLALHSGSKGLHWRHAFNNKLLIFTLLTK